MLGGDLNIIRPSSELEQVFLAFAITGASPHEQMARRAQGKTIVHLHNDDLKEVDIVFPSISEQTKIGSLLHGIENLITLHQRNSMPLLFLANMLL
jgi:type I restriction enzyme S subunit